MSEMELPDAPAVEKKQRPAWVVPAVVAVVTALVTVGGTSIYVTSVIGQWEAHTAALEEELDTVTRERDRVARRVDATEVRAIEAETALSDAQAELDARTAAVDARAAELTTAEQAIASREAAVSGAEARVAATTITTGTWVVGRDVEAGTYTTKAPVDSDCYWGIYRTGSNGDDIIENDLPGGGYPTVTLAAGQDFQTKRCGDWAKQ